MQSPDMPLIGALVLAVALTAAFLRAFWRMDLDPARQRHRRAGTPRRQLIACTAAAVLPVLGALSMLAMAGHAWTGADAPVLAGACAAVGWLLHSLMDSLMRWGAPRSRA